MKRGAGLVLKCSQAVINIAIMTALIHGDDDGHPNCRLYDLIWTSYLEMLRNGNIL